MKKFKLTIHGNPYEVEILNVEDNSAEVEINGVVYKVEIDKQIKPTKTPVIMRSVVAPSSDTEKATVKTSKPSEPKGAGFIKSPLPGVILNLLVKEGQKVKIGDKLLILEAMKMENNIESDKEGIVKTVRVRQGDAVLEGDILVEIGSE